MSILYGWSGKTFEQEDDGVELVIGDGRAKRHPRAKYLVGADGSRSTVREAAGTTEMRTDHDRLMALFVFDSTELHELLQRCPGKAIYKVLHPDLDGYWMFFGRVDHRRSWFAPVSVYRNSTSPWPTDTARVACSLRATRPIPILPKG